MSSAEGKAMLTFSVAGVPEPASRSVSGGLLPKNMMTTLPKLSPLFTSVTDNSDWHTTTNIRPTASRQNSDETESGFNVDREMTSHETFLNSFSEEKTQTVGLKPQRQSSSPFIYREVSTSLTGSDGAASRVHWISLSNNVNISLSTDSSATSKSMPKSPSSERYLSSRLNQPTADYLSGSTTHAMDDASEHKPLSESFKSQLITNTTRTNDTVLRAGQVVTADTSDMTSSPSSPLFDVLTSNEHEALSPVLSNVSFNQSKTMMQSFSHCLFSNKTLNNFTDFNQQGPCLYDLTTEDFDVGDSYVSTTVMAAKVTTLALLTVAGVAGNGLVMWSVVRQRHLHRPPFCYLLSLSLTDLARAAFCLPLVMITVLQGSVWRHGHSACDLFAFANSFFVLSSSVSLLDMVADRHLALVYSRSYRRQSGGMVSFVVVLLGWSLAFIVAFPPLLGVGAYAFEASEGQCTLRHKFFRHNNDTLGFLMVFTALTLLTLFIYYRLFLALRAHRKMRPLQHQPATSSMWTFIGPGANGQAFINWMNGFGGAPFRTAANQPRNPLNPNFARVANLRVTRNQHVTRLFFMMTFAFDNLLLPYQVLSYWRVFGVADQIDDGFVTAAAWLSYGEVAVCPLVYFCSRWPSRRRSWRTETSGRHKEEFLLQPVSTKK